MELLIEKEFISIFYDPRHFIVAQWKGYFSTTTFKEGMLLIAQMLKEKKCSFGLNDGRLAKGTFLQNIQWLQDEMMPNLMGIGIKKIAYVTSGELASLRSLDRVLELTDEYEAQLFVDYDEAVKWLIGQQHNMDDTSHRIKDKLSIREKERFILIDYDNILFLYSFEKGTAIHCKTGLHVTKLSLKEVFSRLPSDFYRIHRGYIVNICFVSSIKHHKSGSYHLFLKDLPGIKIPVGKNYVPTLKKLLNFESL